MPTGTDLCPKIESLNHTRLTHERYEDFAQRYQDNTESVASIVASAIKLGESGRAHRQRVESILNRLLEPFIHSFSYKAPDFTTTRTLDPPSRLISPFSAEDVATIFGYLYKINPRFHINAVDSVHGALTKLPAAVLDGFAIQLLQHLSTSIRQDRSLVATYASLFRTILMDYVEQYVQHRPPQGDWTRRPVGCNRCQDCRRLDDFLRDPAQEVGKFDLKLAGRVHLHEMLNSTNHKHVSLYRGVLKVTKGKGYQGAKYDEWARRHSTAQKKMSELGRGLLIEMLGKDDVEQLLACKVGRRDVQALEPPVTGTKRKRAESAIIDLT